MPKARIEILFDPETGQLALNAPTNNLMLCYAMLELAKDVCRSQAEVHTNPADSPRVQIAEGLNIPNLPNLKS